MGVAQQHSQYETVCESDWKSFHKVTPISKLGSFWLVIVVGVYSIVMNYFQVVDDAGAKWNSFFKLFASHIFFGFLLFLGIFLLVSFAIIVCAYIIWRNMGYAIVESGIHFRKGVFTKIHVHIRWDRVQTVEIEQTLFGRIFGFGVVKVKSADDTVELGLLRLKQCARLRKEILHIEHGIRSGYSFIQAQTDTAGFDPVYDSPVAQFAPSDTFNPQEAKVKTQPQMQTGMRFLEANEVPFTDADQYENDIQVFMLPTARLIGASFLRLTTIFSVFFSILLIVVPAFWEGAYIAVFIGLVALLWGAVKSLFDEYGTKVYLSENGLRIRSGLTKVKTRTYPPQRIHAVTVKQPILWRRFDWWKIDVSVATRIIDQTDLTNSFVFAASKNELINLLWLILPRLGAQDDARLLTEALEGSGTGEFFQGASKRARIFDPISLPGRGFFASKEVFIVRNGRWSRRVIFILQNHTQSMRISRGPLAVRSDIANFAVHTVQNEAVVKNFDFTQIQALSRRELELTKLARKERISESLQEWKNRLGLQ